MSSKSIQFFQFLILSNSKQFKNMNKNKKKQIVKHSHSRKSSIDKQRASQPRLTMYVSPRNIRNNTNYFISNPNSLQKKKPKVSKKKMKISKQFKYQPTRQTMDSSSEQKWRESLKLTFRSSPIKIDKSIYNDSLKCIKELDDYNLRVSCESFMNLNNSFPKHQLKKVFLSEKQRVYLIDWLNYISTQFSLRRNTFHLAVAYLDQYLNINEVPSNAKLQILGAGALLLAIKQQQRGGQNEILTILSNEQIGQKKQQIIKCQTSIVLGLNFKLNYPTIPFWCDYFSQKWDKFVLNNSTNIVNIQIPLNEHLIIIRKPQAINYRYYRQLSQLSDAIIMQAAHRNFQFTKLSLAMLYLIIRINSQSQMLKKDNNIMYQQYHSAFKLKSTPIFRDMFCFNAIFNDFLAETCNFQLTEIIVMIKWCSAFLDIGFTYQIDITTYESSFNYEQFLRCSTYSEHIRNYYLSQFK